MFPLPSIVENTLLMKLQTCATIISTWTLQALGVAAARSGNVISIDSIEDLSVAEACSGLRMLTIFGAMAVALVMIIDRPWWDRLAILVLAIPIAIISNVIRIVTTGLLFMAFGQETPWLNTLIHDWAGFAMMPIGLGLLWVELAILSRLTIPMDAADYGDSAPLTRAARWDRRQGRCDKSPRPLSQDDVRLGSRLQARPECVNGPHEAVRSGGCMTGRHTGMGRQTFPVSATGRFSREAIEMAQNGSDFGGPQVLTPAIDAPPRAMIAAPPMAPSGLFPGFGQRGPEILVGGFNQMWLMNCLRRRWLLATLMGLLIGGAVAGLLMWLFPESSRITAYLEVKSEDTSSPFLDQKRPVNQLEIERQAAMHPALMKSPLVLEAALIRDDIAQLDAVQYHKGEEVLWLLDELKVNFATDSPILEVAYEGEEDPEDMVKIVNAVVKSYRDNVLFRDRLTQTATQEDLASVLDSVRAELQKKLEDLKSKSAVSNYQQFQEYEYPKLKADIALYQAQLIQFHKELADLEVMKQIALQQSQSPSALDAAVQAEMEQRSNDLQLQAAALRAWPATAVTSGLGSKRGQCPIAANAGEHRSDGGIDGAIPHQGREGRS